MTTMGLAAFGFGFGGLYAAYYNYHRSHQVLENQLPVTALGLEGSL